MIGVCGKNEELASIQDTIIFALKGIAAYATHARQLGYIDPEVDGITQEALKPRVGLLPTGNELLEPQQQLVPGKIRDSNTFMLAALIREAGGIPVVLPALSDDYQETAAAIEAVMG